jgi:hypothetical protein
MKKCVIVQILCVVLFLGFQVSESMAIGLGLYGSSGSGSAEWEAESSRGDTWDFEKDTEYSSFGFVLDTAVAKDRLFNHRLSLGQEKCNHKLGDNRDTLELDNFVMVNDFGFGIVRQPLGQSGSLRVWIGPELKISFGTGTTDFDRNWDVNLVAVSIGPAVGVNFNFGSVFTLGLTGGYLSGSFIGRGEDARYDYSEDYTGTESHYFLSLAIIFRIHDAL